MSTKEKSIVDLSDHILRQKNLSDDKGITYIFIIL